MLQILVNLTGDKSHYCICVKAYSIKEAMKTLRGLGFHLGKDFIYWRLCMSDYHLC